MEIRVIHVLNVCLRNQGGNAIVDFKKEKKIETMSLKKIPTSTD